MKLVAVTSCPTGIAHSQMAAENLEQTAEAAGHDIQVEVQGAMGAENELSAAAIASADVVIIAADTAVQRDRFEGKPLVKGTVKDAVSDAEGLIDEALERAEGEAGDTERVGESTSSSTGTEREPETRGGDPSKGIVQRLKRLFS